MSILTGAANFKVSYGGGDQVSGQGGADWIHGNGGADSLLGGAGTDTMMGGQGDDALRGGDDDDLLFADLGADSVDGGAGNDVIWGGGGAIPDRPDGADTLLGGAGDDLFGFRAADGADLITDFSYAAGDRLHLDADLAGAKWTAATTPGGALITFETGGSITLAGVDPAAITQGWFA